MDLIFTEKEGLIRDMKVKSNLGCSDHEIVEFKILKGMERGKKPRSQPWTSGEQTGLFRDLLGRVPWDKALEGRGGRESWLMIFKNHHLQDLD